MDVFEQEDCSRLVVFVRRCCKELGQIVKSTVMNLFWIVTYATQMRTGGNIQPNQVADKMCFFYGIWIGFQKSCDALFQFLSRNGRWVAVLNLEAKGEHVAQQRIGQ